jgi:hypothetical protein
MRGILCLLCGAGNKSVNPLHDALGERDRLLDGAPTANLATSGDSIFPGELGERDGVRIEDIQMQGVPLCYRMTQGIAVLLTRRDIHHASRNRSEYQVGLHAWARQQ